MIHLISSCDERFAPGLFVTAASALVWLDRNEPVTFHLLDAGVSERSREKLRGLCARLHPQAAACFHSLDESLFEGLRPGANNSRLYYSCLVIAGAVPEERALYLDADLLIQRDLAGAWRTDLQGRALGACRDFIPRLADDCPWPLTAGEADLPYFNSGFLLADLAQWRAMDLQAAALDLARRSPGRYRFHDQTLLNYILRGRIATLDPAWNGIHADAPGELPPPQTVLHFTGRKPWLYYDGSVRGSLWRLYYTTLVGPWSELLQLPETRRGFVAGWAERIIRASPPLRSAYLRRLKARGGEAVAATIHFYEHGVGAQPIRRPEQAASCLRAARERLGRRRTEQTS